MFAEDEVFCQGMVIGAVVAKDQSTAQRAARKVHVEYQDLPAIITMEEAIAAKSYHDWPNNIIQTGDKSRRLRELLLPELQLIMMMHFPVEKKKK